MKTSLLFLSFATLAAGPLAQATAQAQSAPSAAFKLQHRSTFAAPKGPHKENPFWPIGWAPSTDAQVASGPVDAPAVTESSFVLSSVLLGAAPQLAVINGREYTIGDQVPVTKGAAARAQLLAIRDGEAVLRYNSQDIVVALKIR